MKNENEVVYIEDKDVVTVTTSGNVIERTYRNVRATPEGGYITKLDADHYAVNATGEVCEYQHGSTRADGIKSLLRTFADIRRLVNCNTTHPERCRWCTMTYAENMTNSKQLYEDFRRFNQKFQRKWGRAEYICVAEPQARGAWHLHIIYIWDAKAPYLPPDQFAGMWGHGFCRVTALDENCDNLGAYLSAYLGDIDVTGEDEFAYSDYAVVDKVADGQTKRIAKGARLSMYPVGMQIYRCSRGVARPKVEKMTNREFEKLVEGLEVVSDTTYSMDVRTGDDERRMYMRMSQYNTKRRAATNETVHKV